MFVPGLTNSGVGFPGLSSLLWDCDDRGQSRNRVQHAVKLYEGDFHGLTWNVSLFITSDLWIDPTHAPAVLAFASPTTVVSVKATIYGHFHRFQLITNVQPTAFSYFLSMHICLKQTLHD